MPVPHTVARSKGDIWKRDRARQLRKTQTPAEARLWGAVRNNRLGARFRRQQVVEGFIVDFYCHEAAVIVEIDGPVHGEQCDADGYRDAVLGGWGFTVLRFSNDDLMDRLPAALARIRQAIKAAPDTCS